MKLTKKRLIDEIYNIMAKENERVRLILGDDLAHYVTPVPKRIYKIKVTVTSRTKGLPLDYGDQN